MSGGHVVVARYDLAALDLLGNGCIFITSDRGRATSRSPSPSARPSRPTSRSRAPARSRRVTEPPVQGSALPNVDDPAVGRQGAAEHPPDRHRPAAEGGHVQHRHADRRLDRPDDEAGRDVQPAARHVDVPMPSGSAPQRVRVRLPRARSTRSSPRSATGRTSSPGTDRTRGYNGLKLVLGNLYELDIKYFVEVNFDGFKQVVDAMGGVTINVQIPVIDETYPSDTGRLVAGLHPGRPPAHDRRRGARLRPVTPQRPGRLRPRRPPAAGPDVAPRAGRRRQPRAADPGARRRR